MQIFLESLFANFDSNRNKIVLGLLGCFFIIPLKQPSDLNLHRVSGYSFFLFKFLLL
jgi:hypothetical protein